MNLNKIVIALVTCAVLAGTVQAKPKDRPRPGDSFREGDYVEPRHEKPEKRGWFSWGRRPAPPPKPAPRPTPPPPPPAPRPTPPPPPPKPVPPPPAPVVIIPGYRPGHHGHALQHVAARTAYAAWPLLIQGSLYSATSIPEVLQYNMRNGISATFSLEENTTTGYTWFARYHSNDCYVTVDHRGPAVAGPVLTGAPGSAFISVRPLHPGDTIIELIYARRWEWEKGEEPAKVLQLFVHVDP